MWAEEWGVWGILLNCFREEVEQFFVSKDRDFDGRLTFEEFMWEETPLEKVFKNMDKDGDGLVTKKVSILRIIEQHNIT